MPGRNQGHKSMHGSVHARLLALLLGLVAFAAHPAQAEMLEVTLDQAQVLKLPERAATIVIGNPLIADVSLQAGGLMVVTGKGYGATNILAPDGSGGTLMNTTVRVTGARDIVVVYRGVDRESYSCTPKCARRITLGDAVPLLDTTLGQAGSHVSQTAGNAQSAK